MIVAREENKVREEKNENLTAHNYLKKK